MKRHLVIAVGGLFLSVFAAYWTVPPLSDPKIDAVFVDLMHLRKAMDEHLSQGLQAPDDSKGLNALLDPPAMLGRLPKDQWGNDYLYRRGSMTHGYTIYSAGRNGVDERGAGDDVTDRTKFYSCKGYRVGCPMKHDEIVFIGASVLALLFLLTTIVLSVVWAVRRMPVRRAA